MRRLSAERLGFATVLGLIATIAIAQGSQLIPHIFNGPITINGDLTTSGAISALSVSATSVTASGAIVAGGGMQTATGPLIVGDQVSTGGTFTAGSNLLTLSSALTVGGALSAGSNNISTTGRICTTTACTSNYFLNDGFGTLSLAGIFSGTGNWATVGFLSTDDYVIPKTGIKNTGTAAACSSNTGAVCINDAGGLAVANGSGTTVATISAAGYIASVTPHTLTSLELNVAAAAATYGGHILPPRAFTVTGLTGYVSGVSGGGAGNTTWRVSDGTNNCDCNFPCQGGAGVGSNSTGALRCTPSGTCAFAASASLTVAVQTAGCTTTQPTIQNIDVEGNWQ